MFGYYFWLAARSLRRNPVLTLLMVSAIALGIGASMTSLTVLRAMSGNPLPHKEGLVYRPQLDNWSSGRGYDEEGNPPDLMTYQDSVNLYRAQKGKRQAAMFPNNLPIEPANREVKPYMSQVMFTHADFFAMFDVPFKSGGAWSKDQDDRNGRVAVLSAATAEKLFGDEDAVGKTIHIGAEDFTITGVMDKWRPSPRFYHVSAGSFGDTEEVFLPFNVGIERELQSSSNNNCWKDSGSGYAAWLASECIWMDFWVELESEGDRDDYKAFLDNYVNEQKKLGRFERPLNNRLNTVGEWLEVQRVVSRDARTQAWLAAAFLVVCLINTVGLLLAKFLARSGEIGLRRAVGASKREIFSQYLIEAGVVGIAGALLGLALTWLGLLGLRALYAETSTGTLARMDLGMVGITVAVAIVASLLAGLFPTWKAMGIAPATQLKSN